MGTDSDILIVIDRHNILAVELYYILGSIDEVTLARDILLTEVSY